VDQPSLGAVVRLLAIAGMIVTVVSNYWRHGDIDLTGRYANMRTLYARSVIIGVIVAALGRINVLAMLRDTPAFQSYLGFYGVDLVDEVIGVLLTGVVLALFAKLWNDLFDVLYEFKRFMRGKANALRPDDAPRPVREPREPRDSRDRDMRRGRRGGRGRGGDREGGDRDRYRDRDRDMNRRPEGPREPNGIPTP
jgi:hypothetical protein